MPEVEYFKENPGFCRDCGSILPPLTHNAGVTCYTCKRQFTSGAFGQSNIKYTVHFNSVEAYDVDESKKPKNGEGPAVDRKCSACGNEKMTYMTLQLRSADEGQTVFYTCTACKHKESENS